MLNVYPKHRPHVKDVLSSPFFNKHRVLIEQDKKDATSSNENSGGYIQKRISTNNQISKNNQIPAQGSIHDIIKTINNRDFNGNNHGNFKKKKTYNSETSHHYTITTNSNKVSSSNKGPEKVTRIETFGNNNDNSNHNKFQKSNNNNNGMKKNNVFYSFNNQNSLTQNNQISTGFTSGTISKINSNFQKKKDTQNFKKKPTFENIEVNTNTNQVQKHYSVVQNSSFKKKQNPKTNKLSALKHKILNSNTKKGNSQNSVVLVQPSGLRKISANSKIQFQSQSKSQHKSVDGFKQRAQKLNTHSSSKNTPQKWFPKRISGASSFQTSKLGSKLSGKIYGSNISSSIKKIGTYSNSVSNNKFNKYSNSVQNTKGNLLSISKGEPIKKVHNHAFRSVRNPTSFSSSFQSQRGLQNYSNGANKQNSFNLKRKLTSGSNQGQKMNFLKKKPVKSFVKFLQPKIIKKDGNRNQSFRSNRIIPKFETSKNGTRVVKFTKGN